MLPTPSGLGALRARSPWGDCSIAHGDGFEPWTMLVEFGDAVRELVG